MNASVTFPCFSLNSLEEARLASRNSVTYQIIKGRVFRSKDCLFPLRCRGVEHFLLKSAKKLDRDVELVLNPNDWPFIHR